MTQVEITHHWEVKKFIVEVEGKEYLAEVEFDEANIQCMSSGKWLEEEHPLFWKIYNEVVG